jgi:hypothetical protein
VLEGQAAVADELTGFAHADDPEAESMVTVTLLIPGDPLAGFAAGPGPRVETHNVLVAKQCGHVI